MERIIRGQAYVLGDDIDTDQIIPASFLSYNPAIAEERKLFGRYALCGVPEAAAGLPAQAAVRSPMSTRRWMSPVRVDVTDR